ncbi:MAG: hypothetical protein V4857_08525 [Pseudomonadota bacterium]
MQAAQLFNHYHLNICAFCSVHMGLNSMRNDRQRFLSRLLHHLATMNVRARAAAPGPARFIDYTPARFLLPFGRCDLAHALADIDAAPACPTALPG